MSTTGLVPDELLIGTARGPGIYIAPVGTAAPATLSAAWASPWRALGYATEDGPTVANSTDTEDIMAWQSRSPLRTVITGRTVTVQMQLMQWNGDNLAVYWDVTAPTVSDGVYTFDVRSDQSGRRHSIGVDVQDGDNQLRIVFPRVQLSAAGDMQFQRGAAALLDVTFSALETDGRLATVMGSFTTATLEAPAPAEAPAPTTGGGSASRSSSSAAA